MKKIYSSPIIETTQIRFNYVMSGTLIDNGGMPGNPGAQPPTTTPAPRRRVF